MCRSIWGSLEGNKNLMTKKQTKKESIFVTVTDESGDKEQYAMSPATMV